MEEFDKIMLWGAIPIIIAAAIVDYIFVETHTFFNYIYICAWEYTIFWFGMWAGRKIGLNEANKIRKMKKE